MKNQSYILAAILIIITVSLNGLARDRHLSRQATAVDVDNKVWDFSQTDETDEHPVYRTYGDSLITEIFDGCRQWYSLRNDSAFYLGEETRFYKAMLDAPIPTSNFGNLLFNVRDSCEATGVYYKSFAMGQKGDYESCYPVSGRLIISADNEISANAVIERQRLVSWIVSDTLPDGFTTTKERIRTRWFVAGDPLPIALQITENRFYNNRTVSTETKTFILPGDEIKLIDNVNDEVVQQALDNAEITIVNGIVRIEGDFPENTILTLFISNLGGNQFHQNPLTAEPNGIYLECRLPYMPPGQYILTISAGTPSSRKIAITI